MTMLQKSSNNPAISKPQGIYSDSSCFFNMRLINLCDFSYEGHLIYQYPMCDYNKSGETYGQWHLFSSIVLISQMRI